MLKSHGTHEEARTLHTGASTHYFPEDSRTPEDRETGRIWTFSRPFLLPHLGPQVQSGVPALALRPGEEEGPAEAQCTCYGPGAAPEREIGGPLVDLM